MGRRGRKSTAGKREPNGQLSRKPEHAMERALAGVERDERDALTTGLEARVRVLGVRPEDSRDQMAGSFVGRLCMQRVISRIQYEAAITYAVEREAYLRAVAPAQGSVARAVNLNATHGSSNYENETKTRQDVARYRAAYAAIIEAWRELRGQGKLLAAIQRLVIEDEPFEALVPDLRTALNALAKHYGLSGNTRKAA
jgi:hypothetical protein